MPELSGQLARKLISLDHKLGNTKYVITDVLSYGSSLHVHGQDLEAEAVFRQALDLSLEIESWQQAAAASSNLAMTVAARGELKEARAGLDRSLTWLAREPDRDTAIRTQGMIIGIMNAQGTPPVECFRHARHVIEMYRGDWDRSCSVVLGNALTPVLNRFFADNPALDSGDWVPRNFPELMEDPDA